MATSDGCMSLHSNPLYVAMAQQLLSIKSETHVLDCHGDRVFQWDSGSAIQAAINSFQINAQYLIRKNGTLIAYVDR